MLCKVKLLDSAADNFNVRLKPNATGKVLMDAVCRKLGIEDPEIFGFRCTTKRGEVAWLNLRNPVRAQVSPQAPHLLTLRVKYFVPPAFLTNPVTKRQLFLELKHQVVMGEVQINDERTLGRALALLLRIEYGHVTASLAPHLFRAVCAGRPPRHVARLIRDHMGDLDTLDEPRLKDLFLQLMSQFDCYGQERFQACLKEQRVTLLVNHETIKVLSTSRNILKIFRVDDITAEVSKKTLLLTRWLHSQASQHKSHKFVLESADEAREALRCIIEQQVFFTMNTVPSTCRRAHYHKSWLGSAISAVYRKSSYRRLYSFDVYCTLEDTKRRAHFGRIPPKACASSSSATSASSGLGSSTGSVGSLHNNNTTSKPNYATFADSLLRGTEWVGFTEHLEFDLSLTSPTGPSSPGLQRTNLIDANESIDLTLFTPDLQPWWLNHQSPVRASRSPVKDSGSRDTCTERVILPPPSPRSPDLVDEPFECQICFEEASQRTVIVPCGHSVSCQVCSEQMAKCPICRGVILRVQPVLASWDE